MIKTDLKQFLCEQQLHQLNLTIKSICEVLPNLPTTHTIILKQIQRSQIHYLKQIDPQGSIIIEQLSKINQSAIYTQLSEISKQVRELISNNMENIKQSKSLICLSGQISQLVNRKTYSKDFQLRFDENVIKQGILNLWAIFHDQLSQILMGICGFIHKKCQLSPNQLLRDKNIEQNLEYFRSSFQRMDLEQIEVESEQLKRLVNKMKEIKTDVNSLSQQDKREYQQAYKLDKMVEFLQKQQEKLEALPFNIAQQQSTSQKAGFMQKIANKGVGIFKQVKNIITDNQVYKQKSVSKIGVNQFQTYLQNLSNHFQIVKDQQYQIKKLIPLSIQQLLNLADSSFTQQQITIINHAIKTPGKQWAQKMQIKQQNQLADSCTFKLIHLSELLLNIMKQIIPTPQSKKRYFILPILFFKALEQQYGTFTKKYLQSVLRDIQAQLEIFNKYYLRGVIKQMQNQSINPTQVSKIFSRQRPIRSQQFQSSQKSIIHLNFESFQKQSNIEYALKTTLYQIKNSKDLKQQIPQITFQRLNCSKAQTKIVTIVVSGFLSQQSSKDLEWMGLIRALQSQVYCLGWKSSSLKQTGKYLGNIALTIADIALNPVKNLAAGGVLSFFRNSASMGMRWKDAFQDNPFYQAHIRSRITGIYLAEFITKVYPDRYINLVGFSLGGSVITECLKHLQAIDKISLINKAVYLGAAVTQDSVAQILRKSNDHIELVNVWSSQDYAVRYIYRLCRLGSRAMGSDNLPEISSHSIKNIDSGDFIRSHMDFRSHLYGVTKITGMIHD